MQDTRENAQQFYEVLTGVFNDEQSKITRIVCFTVLLVGMLWGGFNYYRATVLADTSTPIDEDLFQDNYVPGNDASLNRIVDLAQAVDAMRLGGETLATAIDSMNRMPFNLDPTGREGLTLWQLLEQTEIRQMILVFQVLQVLQVFTAEMNLSLALWLLK